MERRSLVRSTLVFAMTCLPFSASAAPLLINEVDVDQAGTDALEFLELYDGGDGGSSLDGYSLVFFNGSTDTAYQTISLSGYDTDANGFFVIGSAGTGATGLSWTDLGLGETNRLQNGADAVALYGPGSSVSNGMSVSQEGLVDALVYDTSDADDSGLLSLFGDGPQAVQINEDGTGASDLLAMARVVSTALDGRAWTLMAPTPGLPNMDAVSAVPLPATAWLLLSGLFALLAPVQRAPAGTLRLRP